MTIIAIANSKGGVGKSTLAVHLAAWLDKQGHRVTLADCDTQQSSSQWIREAAPQVKALCLRDPDPITPPKRSGRFKQSEKAPHKPSRMAIANPTASL